MKDGDGKFKLPVRLFEGLLNEARGVQMDDIMKICNDFVEDNNTVSIQECSTVICFGI
jgi:hypothetical protein